MINLLRSGLLLMMALLFGCGWNGTPTRNNDFMPLTSITISSDYQAIAQHTSTKLKVIGNFSGLFTRDVTDQVVWSSGAQGVADFITAASPSRVSGLVPGNAILTATVAGVSSSFSLTVSSATLTTLTITPAVPTIAKGLDTQFAAIGTFSDTTTQNLTFDATWASTFPVMATVSDAIGTKGLVHTLAVGTPTISATFDGVSATTLLTVTEPVLQSIALSPSNPSLLTLLTKKITAIGTYSDGSTPDITSQVTWSSSNINIATIASDGTATALTQGSATISATVDGISGTTSLTTTGGNLNAINVTPAIVTLVRNTPGHITAIGTFSNGSIRDITGRVTWTPANASLATVTAAGGNLALLNPLAVTSATTITATAASKTATTTLTVTSPTLLSIVMSTTSLALTVGTSSPLSVIATFSDATTQDVTSLCTWTSNNTSKATLAAGGLGTEQVTGVAAGTTTISATYGGKTVSTPVTVTVTSRVLQSLAISSPSAISVGNQVSYSATATYGDTTTVDVTNGTTWSLSAANIAMLADSVNQPGQLVGVAAGSVTLTASFGGKTESVTIVVTGP